MGMKAPDAKHCSCPDCQGSAMNECPHAAEERGNRAERERLLAESRDLLETRQYLEREIQDFGKQLECALAEYPKIPQEVWIGSNSATDKVRWLAQRCKGGDRAISDMIKELAHMTDRILALEAENALLRQQIDNKEFRGVTA